MRQHDTTPTSLAGTTARRSTTLWLLLLCCLLGFGLATPAQASHYRYGSLTWQTTATTASTITVQFKVSQAFRRSFYGSIVGGTIDTGYNLTFGDGGSARIILTVSSIDLAADVFYGDAIISHTYARGRSYTALFTANARISTLQNNADQPWYVSTTIDANAGAPVNSSPVSTLPPIVNLATGQGPSAGTPLASFLLPAADPDSNPLTFSVATAADLPGVPFTNAPGLTVDPTTGLVKFNTAGRAEGQLFNAIIKVSDGRTSIMVDFIIKITRVSTPPVFDYSVTPANAYAYQLTPGQSVNFTVRATDSDPGDVVTLSATGLPAGSAMAPALPRNGNPVASSFSWTPTLASLGTYVINFTAQDALGVQANTSVTIQVSQRPVFAVPPSPANGSVMQHTPGTPFNFTLQAYDVDPLDRVTIESTTGPAAATFTPALPTAAANPTTTQFNWVPTVADWGQHLATFTARDLYNGTTTHTVGFIVNSAPSFVSSPGTPTVVVGHPYSYDVVTTDPDLPYGDMLEVVAATKPAWLTLVDNGDGTATLSGTPTAGDVGLNHVELEAEDIYHHGNSYGEVAQAFDINVILCNTQLSAVATNVDCYGKSNGSIALTVSGGTAPFTFAWTGPGTFASADEDPSGLAAGLYTVTVTDANNCQESLQVTVTEPPMELPQISCRPNIDANSDAAVCGAVVTYAVPVGTHSCRSVSTALTAGLPSGALFPIGITLVTYTVTDETGNSASCSFTVTVTDGTAPVVHTRPATVTLVNGTATVSAAQVDNGSTDNCTIGSMSVSPSTFSCSSTGANTVQLTVTDIYGNTSTGSAVVTVVGGPTTPVITVIKSNSVYTGGGPNTLYLGYGAQTATLSATGGASYSWSPSAGLSNTGIANPVFTPTAPGTYTYTVTATNDYGCRASASVTLTVIDVRCGNKNDKVTVCHNGHEICISPNAVDAHLTGHPGDVLGSCAPARGVASASNELVAYPNPATARTTLSFRAVAGQAKLQVYNQLGQLLSTLFEGPTTAGEAYTATLDSQQLAAGVYQCRLVTNTSSETIRLVVAK